MRLLIAEDDPDIVRALTALFEHNKYTVDAVSDGRAAFEHGMSGNYDGIILDIMMPGMDGLEVLRRLRASSVKTPILFLTAKGDVEDRVDGLDAGADDYLPKPFAVSELLARVRAMLRRRASYQNEVLAFGGLELDPASFEISFRGSSLRLSSREFQMMQLLMQSPGIIIPTDQFMEKIWGWDSEVEVSIVWVYISNLRKKIHRLSAPVGIRAVRGVGYCMELSSGDKNRLETEKT